MSLSHFVDSRVLRTSSLWLAGLGLLMCLLGVWLGRPVVPYGYLGLHPLIWQLLPFVACLNLVLGVGLWAGFVVGDLSTKTIGPAMGNLSIEYWAILYLGMLLYTLTPALVGRLLHRYAQPLMSRVTGLPGSSSASVITRVVSTPLPVLRSLVSGPVLLQSLIVLVGVIVSSSILMHGIHIGTTVLVPRLMETIWHSVYISLGQDLTCHGTTNMLLQGDGYVVTALAGAVSWLLFTSVWSLRLPRDSEQ
jgi:hypothetical protein